MLKFSGPVVWRLGTRATFRKYTNPSSSALKFEGSDTKVISEENVKVNMAGEREAKGLVAAAFASLSSPENTVQQKTTKPPTKPHNIDMMITKATDVNSLLVAAENPVVSRRHALKMVSVLSEWSTSNKVKLSDFERDPRFLKLCRILARTRTTEAMASLTMAEDLSTVLGITGDDEAARLIANLSLTQMVKVMKALSQRGRRSTPLLQALSHNITKQADVIDLKKAADLLYCMVILNFPDPLLMDRICRDSEQSLSTYTGPGSVVASMTTALGRLRWRHPTLLAALAAWWAPRPNAETPAAPRAADVAAMLVTMATLNYVPPEADHIMQLASRLRFEDMSRASSWVDVVWSLLVLGRASREHLASCLQSQLLNELLLHTEISIPLRRKLICIDAYSQQVDPTLPRLDEDVAVGVPLVYTKEKTLYVAAILDTFRSLVSADTFLKKDCNSGMGFLYDAEFAVDSKCNPVPLQKAVNDKSVHRIAVLGLDYHDMTRNEVEPLGHIHLYTRMLQAQGFKVLTIPYTEFNPKDKLINRVQYIEQRLKALIKEQQTKL